MSTDRDPIEPTAVYDSTDRTASSRMRVIAGRTLSYGRAVAEQLGAQARTSTRQARDEARLLRENPRGRARTYQDKARWAVDRGREQARSSLRGSDKAVDWTEDRLSRLLEGAQERVSGGMERTFGAARRGVATGAQKARDLIHGDDETASGTGRHSDARAQAPRHAADTEATTASGPVTHRTGDAAGASTTSRNS